MKYINLNLNLFIICCCFYITLLWVPIGYTQIVPAIYRHLFVSFFSKFDFSFTHKLPLGSNITFRSYQSSLHTHTRTISTLCVRMNHQPKIII